MSEENPRSLIREVLTHHIGQEVTLCLRDYLLVDGTHTRCVQRQGVVYRVSDEDVELIAVSPFTKEAVVHAIKLDHILEVQGRILDKDDREWFSGTDAARREQWSGYNPWNQ